MSKKSVLGGAAALLLIGIFIVTAVCYSSGSAGDNQDALKEPALNSGTYQISTADEFLWLAENVNNGSKANANAVLTGDLDLKGIEWVPMGTYEHPFQGVFDAKGHKIDNLNIDSAEPWQGLFGISTGEIKNIGQLTGKLSCRRPNFGSVVGENRGAVVNCASSIKVQCMNNSDIVFGGITGKNAGTISTCRFDGIVTAEYIVAGKKTAGGIAGVNEGLIEKCINTGTIKGHGKAVWTASYFAGIAGTSEFGDIYNCENSGMVEVARGTTSTMTSGITTTVERTGYVSGCIDKGNVSLILL